MRALLVLLAGAVVVPAAQAAEATVQLHDNPFHVAITPTQLDDAGRWTFRVSNQGSVPHDFTLCSLASQGGCAKPLAFTPLLSKGQNMTLTVDLQDGSYEYLCRVAGHADGGMKGTLRVGSSGTASTPAPSFLLVGVLLGVLAWGRRR